MFVIMTVVAVVIAAVRCCACVRYCKVARVFIAFMWCSFEYIVIPLSSFNQVFSSP